MNSSSQTAPDLSQLFEIVLSSIRDFAYSFDREGRLVYANRALLDLWGIELIDAVGKNFFDLKYPDDLAAKLQRQIQQVFTTKQTLSDRTHYTSPSGAAGFYEYIFTPVLATDGSVELVAGSTRDITDLHRTLEALQLSEEHLRQVVEASGRGTWELDVTTGSVTGDARFFTLMGLPHGLHLTLESAIGALHIEDRERVSRVVADALAGENEGRYHVEHRTIGLGDAPERWVEARGRARFDADGKAVSLMGTGVDITERKRAEQALRESESRFRQLADTVPQMVWVTRPDGFHEYYNRRWYEFTGVPEGSTDGEGWNKVFHPDDQEQAWGRWRHSLATGEPYEIEYRLRHHSGEYRWTLGRALPIRDGRGEIERWFGTCTDIDDMKRLVEEREQLLESEHAARTEAEHASRLKDEFLATLSHELRTPLTSILGWARMLRGGGLAGEAAEHALEVIERNAQAQNKLIGDILDVSRIITGQLRLDVRPVDLSAIVTSAVEAARPAAEARGVRLQAVLLASSAAEQISGDADRLQQVVWNLLSNAIKFTSKGGRVQVRLACVDSHVEIVVADSGQGISAEFLPHVFDRFRQADGSTTRRHSGLGLGLAIARQLVELHGGTVHVASAGEGQGATFTVALPLLAMHHVQEGGTERTHPMTVDGMGFSGSLPFDCSAQLEGLRVLVVEDEADTCELLRAVLEYCGAEVATADSANEGMESFAACLPDVLISDIGMPGEDGYALIERVRAREAVCGGGRTPAIALTAYARVDDRARALQAGFEVHLPKPVEPVELVTLVASLAGRTGISDRESQQLPDEQV